MGIHKRGVAIAVNSNPTRLGGITVAPAQQRFCVANWSDWASAMPDIRTAMDMEAAEDYVSACWGSSTKLEYRQARLASTCGLQTLAVQPRSTALITRATPQQMSDSAHTTTYKRLSDKRRHIRTGHAEVQCRTSDGRPSGIISSRCEQTDQRQHIVHLSFAKYDASFGQDGYGFQTEP